MTETNSEVFIVAISTQAFEKLKWLSFGLNLSDARTVEKAIETEFYIRQQLSRGNKIIIQKPDTSTHGVNFG